MSDFVQKKENPFVSGDQKAIPAVLVYLVRNNQEILMLHRNSKKRMATDAHFGRWNGLGGKLERQESPLEAASREVYEEAGVLLSPDRFRMLGVLQFPNFIASKKQDWWVSVLTAEINSDDPALLDTCDEGELSWVSYEKVLSLNLWPGDRHFLPYVLRAEPFFGTLWYENSELSRYWIQSTRF